jgi:hypothetical protein
VSLSNVLVEAGQAPSEQIDGSTVGPIPYFVEIGDLHHHDVWGCTGLDELPESHLE